MPTIGTRNQATREAWLERVLGALPAGARILDAGAGQQANKRFCTHLRYVAQDFGLYDGKGDDAGLQTGTWEQNGLDIVCDITSIPEPDDSFDAILCVEVLEHLPKPLDALRELARLLRPGGTLILTAPFCSLTHFSPYHYYSGFNRSFYQHALGELGFSIEQMEANGNFFHFLAQELLRARQVAEQHCGAKPGKAWTALVLAVLWWLERWSGRDSTSQELLCFGHHVLARKTTQGQP